MKVVALAGGVGGAKLVHGLAKNLPIDELTVIVNTADDFDHFGLRICPDIDTVCYTLAGIANQETGWGQADETWQVLDSITRLGGPSWFRLGDRDFGVHLERTRLLSEGKSLSEITTEFCQIWGISHRVLPMSDSPVSTIVSTNEGDLPFQEYFVKQKCNPRVLGFTFEGIEHALPAPGVLDTLNTAELIILCPSNPWVSIDPIFSVPDIENAICDRNQRCMVVAVSPIIRGATIKGPAAKMFLEMGINPSAISVAEHYRAKYGTEILNGFIYDSLDAELSVSIEGVGIKSMETNTIMKDTQDRIRLAAEVIEFGKSLLTGK